MDKYDDDLPEGYSLLDFNEVLDEEDYESYLEESDGVDFVAAFQHDEDAGADDPLLLQGSFSLGSTLGKRSSSSSSSEPAEELTFPDNYMHAEGKEYKRKEVR